MSRIHVLFLMEDLCFGGTQRQTLQLAQRLDRSVFDVSMLTLTGRTDLDNEAEKGAIRLLHMGSSRRVDPLFFLRLPFWLRRLKPDVIVPCTALPNIWGRIWGTLLGRISGRPAVVGTVRGGGAPKRQYERWLWRLTDHIVCNSEALRDIMLGFGVPGDRLTYIPNGVNTDFFKPSDPPPSRRAPRISCLARLCGDKDQATLISAFEILRRDHPDAILRLVGDGPMEAEVRSRVEHSPAREGIEMFLGTTDVRGHYSATRVFALSSIREGQPNVLIEAMACGLPVCATNVGGIPRLVNDGVNGYLCNPRDPAAMAGILARFLDEPETADAMGAVNRERAVERYSFGPMVRSHEGIFEQLAEERRSASS